MTCQNCRESDVFLQGLAPGNRAMTEVQIGGYRTDVAVVGESEAAEFVVEVRYTHQVSECKALGLNVPWVEVQAGPELLTHPEEPLTLMALNTNLFFYQPCACGNDAFSYPQAEERRRLRVEHEHRIWQEGEQQRRREELAEQWRQHRLNAERRRQEQALEEERARLTWQQRQAELERVQRQVRAFLDEHVPDIDRQLLLYTCVLTPCPGCSITTVFFDGSGMNMMPFWTLLVARKTEQHPWEPVCTHCGWHGPAPKTGERVSHNRLVDVHPENRSEQSPTTIRFWWEDD